MLNENISNPYLIQYCRIFNIKPGEEINTTEYLFWIDDMHDRFHKEYYQREVFLTSPESKEYAKEFVKWLKQK